MMLVGKKTCQSQQPFFFFKRIQKMHIQWKQNYFHSRRRVMHIDFSYDLFLIYNISNIKSFLVIILNICFWKGKRHVAHIYFLPFSILRNLYCISFSISIIRFTQPLTNVIFENHPTLLALNTMRFIILRLHKATMSNHC